MSNRYRHYPETQQERRANQEGWSRPRRRPKKLVSNYFPEQWKRCQRSWKKYRRTRYR